MTIELSLDNEELYLKISRDFAYFIKRSNLNAKCDFTLATQKRDQYELPVNLKAISQSQNSINYRSGRVRYSDYYGKALSRVIKNEIYIEYLDNNFIYELTYLLILSYTGKELDRRGLHKIHACGFGTEDKSILMMMPSKGGKTTLFVDMISDPDINLISDDSPLVNRWGKILEFPLRIGKEEKNDLIKKFPYVSEKEIYEFKREYFSKKYLLSIANLRNKIGVGKKIILINGVRSTYVEPRLIRVGKIIMFKNLMQHLVVGIGLPMIIEHFLRRSLWDNIINSKILLSRLCAAFFLLLRSEKYYLYLSPVTLKNRLIIRKLLK